MTAIWAASEAIAATGGGATRDDWSATGVSIDTRTLESGDLFVALQDVRDGHDFVAQAIEKGAAAALVSRIPDDVPSHAPLLIVDDVLRGLEDLGRAARARTGAQVIAVTGSVGKTSTKEMLRAALAPQGKVHAAERSFNNHWGVPLTLARMPADSAFAVIEIGMNHPGEIAPLSRLARPHVAVVTTVAEVHLEAFDDIYGIAHEKAAILEGLEPGGTAVLNADLETSSILLDAVPEGATCQTFGETKGVDWRAWQVSLGENATVVEAEGKGVSFLFKLATPGRHFALNALAVLAAVDAVEADVPRACLALGEWTPYSGRGTRELIEIDDGTRTGALTLIDDAYNANPTSLRASLDVLALVQPRDATGEATRGRRVAILGDMLELGEAEAAMHAEIADHAAFEEIAKVHCAGPLMKHLWDRLPPDKRGLWRASAGDLAEEILSEVVPGDVVLVKGSLGSKIAVCVDALRKLSQSR